MKNILITIFVLFAFMHNTVNAQKKSEKRNTGYVFINGKYISVPYKVKIKNMALYVNNIQVTKRYPKTRPGQKVYNEYPGVPHCITKESSLDDLRNCLHPKFNVPYITVASSYYYRNYSREKAIKKIEEYIRSLPNISRFEEEQHGIYNMESYSGETRKYGIGLTTGRGSKREQKCDKNGNVNVKKENIERLKIYQRSLLKRIETGGLIIYHIEDSTYYRMYTGRPDVEIPYLFKLMNNNKLTEDQKADTLECLWGTTKARDFVMNYNINKQFEERIKADGYDTRRIYYPMINDRMKNCKTKSSFNSSPNSKDITGWCGNIYEYGFDFFPDPELTDIEELIYDQDYQLEANNIFFDDIPNDDDFGTCTYQNLINMRNAGVVYLAGHGRNDGELLIYATSELAINNWKPANESNILAIQLDPYDVNGWDNQTDLWVAFAKLEWFEENWKQQTIANNSIIIASTCFSGFVIGGMGGGVAFGYNEASYYTGIEENNTILFNNMNGILNSKTNREAIDAYNAIPVHECGFTYNSNSFVTLCPTIENVYPENNQEINTIMGNGYIEFDSWCNASYALDANSNQSPVFFESNPQGVFQINELEWGNPVGGKSKRINYSWNIISNQTNVDVTVRLNTDKIRSWSPNGEGHRLDFDGVTPNAEPNAYYTFTINPDQDLNPNFQAESQQVQAGEDVTFINMSSGSVESQEWYFEGGTPSISYEDNPIVVYNSPGTYDVSLTVSDRYSTLTETKENYITVTENTSDYYTVSGYVEDALFYNIPGATVVAESSTGEITDSEESNGSGAYELQLPEHWTGRLKASKNTFQPDYIEINNLSSILENQNFTLLRNQVYNSQIKWYKQASPDSINCPIRMSTGYVFYLDPPRPSQWYDYYWTFTHSEGNYQLTETGYNPLISFGVSGNYTISVNLTSVDDGTIIHVDDIEVYVINVEANDDFLSFTQSCNIVDVGTEVCFENTSLFPNTHYVYWSWYFEFGTDEMVEIGCIPHTNDGHSNTSGLRVSHVFNTVGHRDVKLESYEERSGWFGYDKKCNGIKLDKDKEYWGAVDVVDCDYQSTFTNIPLIGSFFSGAVKNNYAYDNWGGSKYLYGGNFLISGNSQEYLTQTDMIVSACNEIVIDGSTEFIADGSTELVLESGVIPDCVDCFDGFFENLSYEYLSDNIEENTLENNISCCPNPFNDHFSIEIYLCHEQSVELVMYNTHGQVLDGKRIENMYKGNHIFRFDTKDLPPGIYFIEHNIPNTENLKLIKNINK